MPADAYIISKTALNMLTLRWANQYSDAGFTILAISPGVCNTREQSQEISVLMLHCSG